MEDDLFYGMGWMKKGSAIAHDGTAENFQSNLWFDGDTGIIILVNSNDYFVPASTLLTEGVRDILNGKAPSDFSLPIGAINWTMRILALLVLLFVIRSIYITLAWNRVFKPRRRSVTLHFV